MVKKDPGARMRLCAPCLFGLEGPLGNELRHMGMDSVAPENGRVLFETDAAGLARANIRSRFAERILLELGAFPARSFDELFEGVRAIPLEDWLPRDAAFPVKGWSLESQLHSVPDCQSIIKKAAAVRLGAAYGLSHMPETGVLYQMQFSIMKDEVRIYLDTSGTGLHKRGYRPAQVAAPLRETLAAAMVDIAGYRGRGDFCDPFCGSGTIAIEAALAAKGRAPGINRGFSAEKWACLPRNIWDDEREAARSREYNGRLPHLRLRHRPQGRGDLPRQRQARRRGGPHRLLRRGREGVFPRHGAGRHRHEPALRREADGKARGRAALRRLRSGARRGPRLGPLSAQLPHGARAQPRPRRRQTAQALQRHDKM